MDAEAILSDDNYHCRMLGRRTVHKQESFLYQALVHATRDRLMERWIETRTNLERTDGKRACYLSLEFLMGRLLRNALLSLGMTGQTSEAMQRIGAELEDLHEQEYDAGLGNGGLGRLSACSRQLRDPRSASHRLWHPLPLRHVPSAPGKRMADRVAR